VFPFAKTRAERDAARDPRPSLEERYQGVDDYVEKVRRAAQDLHRQGFLLEEDIERIAGRARARGL